MVALGQFLAAVTAGRMYTPNLTPAVTVVSWGQGADSSVFYQIIEALKLIGLCGGEWKAEGLGGEVEAGCSIQWVRAYAVAESTDSTYLEISPAANADKVQGVMDAWVHYIEGLCVTMSAQECHALKAELIGRARKVAEAAGGLLGVAFMISSQGASWRVVLMRQKDKRL
jgi:hypothetical protein